jgi:NitT/TauT family transport system substrate-binding protein
LEKNKGIAIALTLVVVSSVAVIAFWYPTTVPDVRIGYLSKDLHHLALRVALDNGWFEEAGLNVELTIYQNGGYEMDGFAAGQIDMGYLGAAPTIIKSINQDIGVTILAAANLEGSALMVLKSEYDAGRITNITDLAGKTVFYPGPPTVQSFLLRLALNQSGMTWTDIDAQTTSVSYMEDSLSPDAPAFIAWEPFPAKAEEVGLAIPLLLSEDIWPLHPCCVVASTNSFIDGKPDVVQKVIDIHKRSIEWINANPLNATAIAIDWLEMDESIVELAFSRIIYVSTVDVAGIERYLNFLIEEDQVTMDPSDVESYLNGIINSTFLENSP